MRNLKIASGVIGLVIFCLPLFYWMQNPELTQMQVFLTHWPYSVIGIVLMGLFYV